MAGKVNTKFVVILSLVMVMMLGAALALTLWIRGRSSEDLVRQGDAKMAEKNYEAAERAYSKAVNKDQTNVANAEKWLSALEAWVPDTQTKYVQEYQKYLQVKRNIARLRVSDLKAHREFLDLVYVPFTQERFTSAGGDQVVGEVERTLALMKSSKAETGPIRRYRGLVRVRMMTEAGVELTADKRDEGKADLEAALAADPNDATSAVALMNWHLYQAAALRNAGKDEQAVPFETAGRKSFSEYAAAHPDNATAVVTKLLMDLEDGQRSVKGDLSVRARFDATRAVFETFKPRLAELGAVFAKVPASELTINLLSQFRLCEQYIDPDAKEARTMAILARAMTSDPEDANLMLANAQVVGGRGEIDAAIAQLQKVVDLPRKPIGPEGIRLFSTKIEALYVQAGFLFQKWETTQGEAEKKALVEQVKKLRPVMALSMSEDATPLLYIDAMCTFAAGDMLAARQLLAKFNESTGKTNVPTLWAQAQAELRLNNLGTARELLDVVVQRRGDLPSPHVVLARIEAQLKLTDQAVKRLNAVLLSDPKFQPAIDALQQIKVATGETEAPDKVTGVLVKAERALSGESGELPDVTGAISILNEAIQETPDPRIFLALASLQAQTVDKATAIETVRAGIKTNPEHADLKKALEGLSQADPVKWQLEQVEAAPNATETDKLLQKSQILTNVGRLDEAAAALASAAKASPDNDRVVDRQFLTALRQKNYEFAAKVAEQAKAKNMDRANGVLYGARLLAAQDRSAEAAVLLEQARKAGTADAGSLRLLGRMYAILGRYQDADSVFRDVLRQRPDDVATMMDQVNSLNQAGRGSEALDKAREYERSARGSREFSELLMTLEARHGDRDATRKRREAILTREPSNSLNKLELAKLYADGRRWADATALADQITNEELALDVAMFKARLRMDQSDAAGAQAAMDDHIKSLDPKAITARPFALFGQFFADRRMYNEAVAIGERGRAYQSAGTMEIDRMLGDMLSTIGRADLAEPYYRRVVDAKADGGGQEVRLRLVEMLASLQKWDDASKYMEGVTGTGRNDAIVPLLRADVAAGKGDDRRARELYDRAITDFAQDPMVYFRRAQYFLRKNPPMMTEALQDLDASLKVRPGYWQARRTRSLVYVTLGRRDDAIADLRETIRTNPALDDMRLSLMRELIGLGRASEAAEMADDALKVRPNDANLAVSLSGVFLTAQDWPRGQQYARAAWKLNKSPDIGQAYLDSLLNAEPKNVAEAETVLREKVVSDAISGTSELLLSRAKVLAFRGRMPDATKDMVQSMGVVRLDPPTMVQAWWQDVRRVLTKPDEAVKFLEKNEIPPRFRDWAAFLRASMYADNPQTRLASAKAFEEIIKNAKDPGILLYTYRAWGTVFYQEGKHTDAARVWTEALTKTPDDSELLNNLAYVTARFLNKPEEALPVAERAAAAAPNSSDSMDTLGYCYMAGGKLDEADAAFKKALAVARLPSQRIAVSLHLTELAVRRKDASKAKVYLQATEDLLSKNPAMAPAYKAEIDDARKQIDSLGGR